MQVAILITAILGLTLTMVGLAAAMWKALSRKVDEVHSRINEVRDQYVRRDDIMMHMERLESGQDRIVRRLDALVDREHVVLRDHRPTAFNHEPEPDKK